MTLEELIKNAGYEKQDALAFDLGVDQSSISKWITKKALPDLKKIPKLRKLLNTNYETLINALLHYEANLLNDLGKGGKGE